MKEKRTSKKLSVTTLAFIAGTLVCIPWSASKADDDVLGNPNVGSTPLVFSGNSVEGMAPDDDALYPTPVATLSFGGYQPPEAAAEGAPAPQQAPAPKDPLGISPVIQAILGG